MQSSDNHSGRRRLFCCWYAVTGDPESSALKAGYGRDEALPQALACLRSQSCTRRIAQLRSSLAGTGSVLAGLRRLAFGSSTDAVRLAFSDELPPPEVIDSLDLFNVSEIKRVKGGGVEIKLFDRMKALEKLFELENTFSDRAAAEELLGALAVSCGEEEDIPETE